jgi:aspartyl-tRNA(Asn)/glutamyl-tRNA(Gln) amidotransferase subunit A
MTIGIPKEYFAGGLEAEVGEAIQNAIAVFKDAGISIKEVSLPHSKYALACYYIIMPAEVSANLARFDGIRYGRDAKSSTLWEIYRNTRGKGFGKEVKRRILLGTFVLSSGYYDAYYAKAERVRNIITGEFNNVFDKSLGGVDAILAPTTPSRAFKVGEKTANPLEMYLSDIFTVPVNLAGLPALSLPVKKYDVGSGELPVGFQLIGNRFEDRNILNLGMWYERETGSQNA